MTFHVNVKCYISAVKLKTLLRKKRGGGVNTNMNIWICVYELCDK